MNPLKIIFPLWLLISTLHAVERPNVVVILSDDQSWTDHGFMGHEVIKTPHLDKLAARSLAFERGYVASPLCRPSLASLLTGRFPQDHGVTGNDVDGRNNRAVLDAPVQAAFHKLPSFVKLLTESGYLSHQSGKWWEGSYQDGGFTHGMTLGKPNADPKSEGRHGDLGLDIGRKGMKPITDFLDLAAAEKKPFLLWYAPYLPHTPHNPPQRLLQKYTQPGRADDVAKYYAMCEWFDETCGTLLNALEARGMVQNTLVIYICDNGWATTSSNAADPHQKNFRPFGLRSKNSPFEGGIRSPVLVSWPARIEPSRPPHLAHSIDILPTIAAATGIEIPDDLLGLNLMNDAALTKRDTVYGVVHSVQTMTPGDPNDTLQYRWCVSGDWKLMLRNFGRDYSQYENIHSWDREPVRLYNLKDDPQEKNELSAKHPDIVENLRKKIDAWYPLGAH